MKLAADFTGRQRAGQLQLLLLLVLYQLLKMVRSLNTVMMMMR